MERKNPKICLISFYSHEAFFIPLSNIRKIILEISPDSRSIITVSPELTDKIIFDSTKDDFIIYKNQIKPFFRIINYVILNLKISWIVLLRSKDVDSFLFFLETGLSLPMTIAKLRKKQIFWLLPSSMRKMIKHHHGAPDLLLIPLQFLSYHLADKIVLYSPNLIKEWKLQNYSNKICIAHEHFINTDIFTVTTPLPDCPLLIGCIGRLSDEKGVQNFIQALPVILDKQKDICVLIGGEGPLKEAIGAFLQSEKLTHRVKLAGWISHDTLPEYLNRLRLIVLPSYTEGLPNIMLEAMTCGTPVIATQVGAIPDFIKDGVTGFFMENNSPGCIAENILKVMERPDLNSISMNAKKMVEKEFTFGSAVKQWKKILTKI